MITVIFGLIGFAFKIYGIPRIPFIIGYILGPLTEQFFFQSLQMWRGNYAVFILRSPTVVILWSCLILSLIFYWRSMRKRVKTKVV
ncbi:MAG: hypothetical protein QME90_00960 [Thermodesulfobacteriota bacterium]|nr:hypothetical protein [Thermodesulfobacteriota bacterium]